MQWSVHDAECIEGAQSRGEVDTYDPRSDRQVDLSVGQLLEYESSRVGRKAKVTILVQKDASKDEADPVLHATLRRRSVKSQKSQQQFKYEDVWVWMWILENRVRK